MPHTPLPESDDTPYALKNGDVRERRLSLIGADHVRDLNDLVRRIRRDRSVPKHVPWFDPMDGGVHARCLLLFEAPGPIAVETGFVGQHNPDRTGRNTWELRYEAGLLNHSIVTWNIVPWFLASEDGKSRTHPTAEDREAASTYLIELLSLLSSLSVIVTLGSHASKGLQGIVSRGLVQNHPPLRQTALPSPSVRNVYPQKYAEIRSVLCEVARQI